MSNYTFDPFDPAARTRSAWPQMILGKPLSDKKISAYEKRGFYSAAFQQARREFWQKRNKKQLTRSGNYDILDGRLIYRPT
jgi:hypothetical protein